MSVMQPEHKAPYPCIVYVKKNTGPSRIGRDFLVVGAASREHANIPSNLAKLIR